MLSLQEHSKGNSLESYTHIFHSYMDLPLDKRLVVNGHRCMAAQDMPISRSYPSYSVSQTDIK